MTAYPSDLEIANAAHKKSIDEIASVLDINEKNLIKFGNDKAKLNSDFIDFNGHLTESGFYYYGMLGNIDIFEKCGLIDLFSQYKCGPVTFETNIKFKN